MMNGTGIGLGWIWLLLLVVGLGALLWALVHAVTSTGGGRAPTPRRTQDIVRERFARGEITEEEMRAALRVLDET
jgi:putative membrane protein